MEKISCAIFGIKVLWLNLFLEEHLCSAKSKLPALWHQGSVSCCRQSRLLAATSNSRAKPGEPRRKMMWDRTSLPLSITLCLWASHAAPLQHTLAMLTPYAQTGWVHPVPWAPQGENKASSSPHNFQPFQDPSFGGSWSVNINWYLRLMFK